MRILSQHLHFAITWRNFAIMSSHYAQVLCNHVKTSLHKTQRMSDGGVLTCTISGLTGRWWCLLPPLSPHCRWCMRWGSRCKPTAAWKTWWPERGGQGKRGEGRRTKGRGVGSESWYVCLWVSFLGESFVFVSKSFNNENVNCLLVELEESPPCPHSVPTLFLIISPYFWWFFEHLFVFNNPMQIQIGIRP